MRLEQADIPPNTANSQTLKIRVNVQAQLYACLSWNVFLRSIPFKNILHVSWWEIILLKHASLGCPPTFTSHPAAQTCYGMCWGFAALCISDYSLTPGWCGTAGPARSIPPKMLCCFHSPGHFVSLAGFLVFRTSLLKQQGNFSPLREKCMPGHSPGFNNSNIVPAQQTPLLLPWALW